MKKAVKGLIMSAVILAAGAGLIQTNAMAGNYTDEGFYFHFDSWDSDAGAQTADREKQDDTFSYMWSEYVGSDYTYEGWVEMANGTDISFGHHYTFSDDTTHYMTNYAYEEYGVSDVHIYAQAGWNAVEVLSEGLWSPDSI
ncbi:hypothetical protein CBW65_05605 [Tumebacillus avium]|uniref:Uncharacterized protein n=1 Tax=Tumebacillus avium TaxID=1903704 RepID=A0A1Y0IM32_9BACL|nr:hypothetical protein [Tumebacillus avium]ARU60615.1 hypothetical protein CBW65_05605 [Tumebacillus avium]